MRLRKRQTSKPIERETHCQAGYIVRPYAHADVILTTLNNEFVSTVFVSNAIDAGPAADDKQANHTDNWQTNRQIQRQTQKAID